MWKNLPDEEGDWLWLSQFSCGCPNMCGIAYVINDEGQDWCKLKNGMLVGWENNEPSVELIDELKWLKLDLPKSCV